MKASLDITFVSYMVRDCILQLHNMVRVKDTHSGFEDDHSPVALSYFGY